MPERIAIVDMDGVLCDFFTAALAVHDRTDLADSWPAEQRNMAKAMGISTKKFWSEIDQRPAFWANIQPYPWAYSLLRHLQESGLTIAIATSLSLSPRSASGKVRWIQRHVNNALGLRFRNFFLAGSSKALLAAPGRILIDDYELNCDEFEQAGGQSVLFPARWNCLHGVKNPYEFAISHVDSLLATRRGASKTPTRKRRLASSGATA